MKDRPNIVIVVADAVRAQNLPIYGYDQPTTPRISQLAAEAVRFNNAISAGEQTLSSTTSLFTGMYPSTHRLCVTGDKLNPGLHTLAAALKRGGYVTHCINSNNPYVSPFTDLPRDFDEYVCSFPTLRRWIAELRGRRQAGNLARRDQARAERDEQEATAEQPEPPAEVGASEATWQGRLGNLLRWLMTRTTDAGAAKAFAAARRVLRQQPGNPPVFIYVHLMETHMLYLPPLGHWGLFLPDCAGRNPRRVNQNPLPLISGAVKMDALDFKIVEGLYNGALHYTDRLFGRFFDDLRAEGLLENTLLILTADHGENFGEHGLLGHGQCVYDTVVRVPLLIWGPMLERRQRGAAIDHVVQSIDLTVSCLDWAGTGNDPIREQLEGQALPLADDAPAPRRYAVSESTRAFERRHIPLLQELGLAQLGAVGVRSRTHKMIWNTTGQEEFYDLVRDPAETRNLAEDDTPERRKLRATLEPLIPKFQEAHAEQLRRLDEEAPMESDPQIEQRLRELGYL